jgi:uncharacterized membrane protein
VLTLAAVLAIVLVFTIGLIYGLGLVANALNKPRDPEQLLREQFAKGEIDEGEYAKRLSILKFGPPLEL